MIQTNPLVSTRGKKSTCDNFNSVYFKTERENRSLLGMKSIRVRQGIMSPTLKTSFALKKEFPGKHFLISCFALKLNNCRNVFRTAQKS